MKTPAAGILLLLSLHQIDANAQITVSVNPANKQDARVLLTNPATAAITFGSVMSWTEFPFTASSCYAARRRRFTTSICRPAIWA